MSDRELTTTETQRSAPREFSGHKTVVAMFLFGATATAGLWFYWHYHYAPFQPLQEAIVKEFPGSAPHVEGGRPKMHLQTPRILRIALKVEFNPKVDEQHANSVAQRLEAIAREHHDLSAYDKLEMYLIQRVPEQESPERLIERDLRPADSR